MASIKQLPRSSSETKVDKQHKREARAAKSRSVHFDGSGIAYGSGTLTMGKLPIFGKIAFLVG